MYHRWLILSGFILVSLIDAFGQLKYSRDNEKLYMMSVGYSRQTPIETLGAQVGMTRDGKVDIGLFLAFSTAESPATLVGAFADFALIKPTRTSGLFGMTLSTGLSLSFVPSSSRTEGGFAGSVGFDFYLAGPDWPVFPFIDVGASYARFRGSKTLAAAFMLGLDLPLLSADRPIVVVSVGAGGTQTGKSAYTMDISVALSRPTTPGS